MPSQTVTVLKTFIDRENGMKKRKPGEHFSTSPDRAKYLEILGLVKANDKPKTAAKTAKQTD